MRAKIKATRKAISAKSAKKSRLPQRIKREPGVDLAEPAPKGKEKNTIWNDEQLFTFVEVNCKVEKDPFDENHEIYQSEEEQIESGDPLIEEITPNSIKSYKERRSSSSDNGNANEITNISTKSSTKIRSPSSEDSHSSEDAKISSHRSRKTVKKRKPIFDRDLYDLEYQCKICMKDYKYATPFRKHLRDIHQTDAKIPYIKCKKCYKEFASETRLERHALIHLPDNKIMKIPCLYCDREFRTLATANMHVQSNHQNPRQHICVICGHASKRASDLNEHKLVHTNERPYICETCNKGFKCKSHLHKHQESHSKTTYGCSICGMKLKTRSTLKRHMAVHSDTREHKCKYCGFEFKHAKNLKRHLQLHMEICDYKCNLCNETYVTDSGLRKHMLKEHGVNCVVQTVTYVETSKLNELSDSKNAIRIPRKVQSHVRKRRTAIKISNTN